MLFIVQIVYRLRIENFIVAFMFGRAGERKGDVEDGVDWRVG